MTCFSGGTHPTSSLPESWHTLSSPWVSVSGESVLPQLCRMIDDRLNALAGVRFNAISRWGIAPDDTKPTEYDYSSNPTQHPIKDYVQALNACKTKVGEMLIPVTLYFNGGILNPSECKRYFWANVAGKYEDYIADIAGLDATKQEDWEPLILVMREYIDWMSARLSVAGPWLTWYARAEDYIPFIIPPGLPVLPDPIVENGGLHPSPGYNYMTGPPWKALVKRSDGLQTYSNAVMGIGKGGYIPGAACDIGIGWSFADSFDSLGNFVYSYSTGGGADPALFCPFGWWRKIQSTRRIYFRLATSQATTGPWFPQPSANNGVLAKLEGKTIDWTAVLLEGGQYGTLAGVPTGTLSPASGTITIIGGNPSPAYVDITATLTDTDSGIGVPPLGSNHDDGIQISKAGVISVEVDGDILEVCQNGCGTYTLPS